MVIDIANEDLASRNQILQDLFADKISAPSAAEKLASISLSDAATLQGGLGRLWNLIITYACRFPAYHDKLVDLLVDLSHLPDATADDGQPLRVADMQVWRDLPTLGWGMREEWNLMPAGPPLPADYAQWPLETLDLVNMNRFTALLMATDEPVFSYSWFALLAFRDALEKPFDRSSREKHHPPEAYIPAAAAWIEILGVEIYEWDEAFPSGGKHGRPGRGGPLWNGVHGFCPERWRLWRERFGEVARMEGEVIEEVRIVARDAEQMMREIENGDVVGE